MNKDSTTRFLSLPSSSSLAIDIHKFVKQILSKRNQPQFYILEYIYPRKSAYFSPYALKYSTNKNCDYFFMVSERGVVYVDKEEQSFTNLNQWYTEFRQFERLQELKLFQQFRLSKSFYLWRKFIKKRKFSKASEYLENNLFLLNRNLCNTLFEVHNLSINLAQSKFSIMTNLQQDYDIFKFVEKQINNFQQVFDDLYDFRDYCSDKVLRACIQALNAKGFAINENLKKRMSVMKKFRLHDIKMTYIQKDRKKNCCSKLTRFIILIDYILIDNFLIIINNSIDDLLSTFNNYMNSTIPLFVSQLEVIQQSNEEQKSQAILQIKPSRENFKNILSHLLTTWQNNLKNLELLLSDNTFRGFTNPIIDGRIQDKVCGDGPNFQFYLQNNPNYNIKKLQLFNLIDSNFILIEKYIKNFNTVLEFYQEDLENNSLLDEQTEIDLELLNSLCTRFTKEIETINNLPHVKEIGFIRLEMFQYFIQRISPEPHRLLALLQERLPNIGKLKIDDLLNNVDDMFEKLNYDPIDTDTTIEYLDLMDKTVPNIEQIKICFTYLQGFYEILHKFQFTVPDQDIQKLNSVQNRVKNLQELVQHKVLLKDELIKNLELSIKKDTENLEYHIKKIYIKLLEEWLINKHSESDQVKNKLMEIHTDLEKDKNLAVKLQNYQKRFKMEVSRFQILDEVLHEHYVRTTLWESVAHWSEILSNYVQGKFQDLNVDEMFQALAKYSKILIQLEKAFGIDNLLVNDLKISVENLKVKMPVISSLHNPNLCQRHWVCLEKILGQKLRLDHLTLADLTMMNAYEFENEFNEIAALASSEAALEVMLKKIEDLWQNLEFIILPHRNSKDVFILGTVEDIQIVLDETIITMNTIASSKYVGFLKHQIDIWLQRIDLFQKILDQWMYFQQNWLYLESIFSAPDIQRQLAAEAAIFTNVDRFWKKLMRLVAEIPTVLNCLNIDNLYENFVKNNNQLDQILKCIEKYLETKRMVFPRFYFLSNDELLEILAQTRNPQAVQNHLRKCFDAINRLEFGRQQSNDIIAMISPEGEHVEFIPKGLKARGNVEDWLGKVEEAMFGTLRKIMKFSLDDYLIKERIEWLTCYPSQIVLVISQIMWAAEVHSIFDNKTQKIDLALKNFEKQLIKNLNDLAILVRQELDAILRKIIVALITIDVHARDTISNLIKNRVYDGNNFEWLKMLRYYWQNDECFAKMSNACHSYGYEYLGAAGCLVITPLTDKCYLCLMGALQMDLGGAPSGPAGTGKTETTKDLAKSLAVQCVVFNCSDDLDFKMMGRFFSGLAQCGSWCCFDEFNRIDIEVLSVIAQQLITIKNAKVAKLERFMFENREIKLVRSCAAFITMNPGYAGRTELPDNLKALFRPISMMVPDYAIIAEVILYSEGFEKSKVLAHKMVQMYKLCSEQLSQQDHYDFGMRAVKSVLVMAGQLKRSQPNIDENIVLICALRDSNLPKFLKDDTILFRGILNDLFPQISLPEPKHEILEQAIAYCMINVLNLTFVQNSVKKAIQLHETLIVRWGVMLVGPTGGGKSTTLNILKESYNYLRGSFNGVQCYILNPKSITSGELYGEINQYTLEWKDGLLGATVRNATQCENNEYQWIVCDGPVDAAWIENLNTVLDDNKMLCLANSERIKLTPNIRMIFEVQDLAQASPATVSRCGMVYIDPDDLKWLPYVHKWLNDCKNCALINEIVYNHLLNLFENYVEFGLRFVHQYCQYHIFQVDIGKIKMLCTLLESFLKSFHKLEPSVNLSEYINNIFTFAYLWSIGGNLLENSKQKFEQFVCHQMKWDNLTVNLWDVFVNETNGEFIAWKEIIPNFIYDPKKPYFEMIVPTIDTVRFNEIMNRLLNLNQPVLLTGETGVGKSVISKATLEKLNQLYTIVNFSAQTSSQRIQEIIESKLEKRKKTHLSAPAGKKFILFLDDVNMPKLDTYGSQPPIELLRQYLDYGGLYDRDKLFWKNINDMILAAACSPPGSGGRNAISSRFLRHFAILEIPEADQDNLERIFGNILSGFFQDFTNNIQKLLNGIVKSAIQLYNRIMVELLPTPEKSHYVFNLRDLSKCIQGLLQANCDVYREPAQILRLFYHESLRVFHDRLVDRKDQDYFHRIMNEVCLEHFNRQILEKDEIILFGDFMTIGTTNTNEDDRDKIYEEISDFGKIREVLQEYLDDFNTLYNKEIKMVFFSDAIEHCVRIARILRSQRGHALLVGVGGMGKQSLTRLAAHLNNFKCFQIELGRNYDHTSFLEDLRKLYYIAGVKNENSVFLITDTQIIQEQFLEDINNILNSGQVPNLFEGEEFEKLLMAIRSTAARESGISEVNRDAIFEFFINRVRSNLHLVLCFSPIGPNFRRWCRMFPSLVNCCTIDWFFTWPSEALYSVAEKFLSEFSNKSSLAEICVLMHKSVEDMSIKFCNETQRHNYVTPNSFLELLKLYKKLYFEKRDNLIKNKMKLLKGLSKLNETNQLVDKMKIDLKAMEPELVKKSEDSIKLLQTLEKEKQQVDTVRDSIKKDEIDAQKQAAITHNIAAEAENDLKTVMPVYEAATKALDALNKNDINELKAFQKPPKLVQFVTESVCVLLNSKTDWNSAKILLTDVNFLKRLKEYDKDNIPEKILQKLKAYIDHRDFRPEIVAKTSKVCKSICMWVRAIDTYAKVYKLVEPKIQKQHEAEQELREVMTLLKTKQDQLALVEEKLQKLKSVYDHSMLELSKLQETVDLTAKRISTANKLTTALEDEHIRWSCTVRKLDQNLIEIIGDILLASGCVSYLGPFLDSYRNQLIDTWLAICVQLNISACQNFNVINILSNSYEIRTWNTFGLPRDKVSTENAVLATKSTRWPLMIDPQEQANRWIRLMENNNCLRVVKLTDANFVNDIKHSIMIGNPVLLEEIQEHLDAVLDGVLLKQTFIQSGRTLIRFADADIEYDPNFRLYITTKLANPHYLPEISTKVTLINFMVTPSGLEDQLLTDIVRVERPDLEKQRVELVVKINNDKLNLESFEDKILKLLFSSSGNILDDEELINTLNECKETSTVIATRLQESETIEEKITIARNRYRIAATRGSILYFTIAKLINIDSMYQFSLKYFNQLFNNIIETSERSDYVSKRLEILCRESTRAIFKNVSRALFENNKLIFSFMLCIDILMESNAINSNQVDFLLNGRSKSDTANVKDNPYKTINNDVWLNVNYLKKHFEIFKDLTNDLSTEFTIEIGEFQYSYKFSDLKSSQNWNEKLNNIEKLLLIKAMQEDKLLLAILEFIKLNLGKEFIENEPILIKNSFQDTTKITPLIFILSAGSDPLSNFQKFALESGFNDRYQTISLGQGQGPIAEKLIDSATKLGHWVFLQNCHLATSWMLSLERIVSNFSDKKDIHDDFRLFLSSMPIKTFPISVLQNSVKLTNEVPKGLRSNLLRAFADISDEYVHRYDRPVWKRLIFGLCMFHAIIIERKRYGPLGWNIPYEFNDNDRECALKIIEMFSEDIESVSWDALDYIIGEITYGGRVTDTWDLRCLKTILKQFLSSKIATDSVHYKYSKSSDIYYCPEVIDFIDYVGQLPLTDAPDIFGMHENANMVYELKETQFVCQIVQQCQVIGGQRLVSSAGQTNDVIVSDMILQITDIITTNINYDNCRKDLFDTDNEGRVASLSTVLIQEIDRYNYLINLIHTSLKNLQKSIQGLSVMSESLEQVYQSILRNQVPNLWSKKAYPSLKSLPNWIIDLKKRLDFIVNWLNFGTPNSFWFSGFYFPQGFLTGILQTFARKYNLPIDELQFDFIVNSKTITSTISNLKNDSFLIHGLYLECGYWDTIKNCLVEAKSGQLICEFPEMYLKPTKDEIILKPTHYVCPMYKTATRAGTLSTTGHSTNFVLTVHIPSDNFNDFWVLQGTALLTQLP